MYGGDSELLELLGLLVTCTSKSSRRVKQSPSSLDTAEDRGKAQANLSNYSDLPLSVLTPIRSCQNECAHAYQILPKRLLNQINPIVQNEPSGMV